MAMQEAIIQREKIKERIKLESGVVFITGSSIGIGRETAYQFAKNKWKVIISYYKDEKEAEKTAKKCKELGAKDVLVVSLDVKDNRSILNAVKTIIKKFDKIDVLINNAGSIAWKELLEQSDEEIEDQVRTNLEGMIKLTKYCLPYVKEVIINIASGAGKTPHAGLTTYCATKFGVRGFTQTLALELNRIKVYSVNPGSTATRMTNFKGTPPSEVAKIIFNTAIGKYALPSGSDVDVWDYTDF